MDDKTQGLLADKLKALERRIKELEDDRKPLLGMPYPQPYPVYVPQIPWQWPQNPYPYFTCTSNTSTGVANNAQ